MAAQLSISLRSLYRDIATLQGQGAQIDAEAGVGFVLRPGFMLPPLMFSEEEIEALLLGARFVAQRADTKLADAALTLLAKIAAVLPANSLPGLENPSLLVAPAPEAAKLTIDLTEIRRAIRKKKKLSIEYTDAKNQMSHRTIWPFALGYFDAARVIAAWCESRDDFRHFRCDRISSATVLDASYPAKREALLKQWREIEGVQS